MKKAIIVCMAALMLAGCGKVTREDADTAETTTETTANAGSQETESPAVTTAPESSAPEETSAQSAAVVSPEDEQWVKDSFRSLFGHKTQAQKDREQYYATMTTTTMTTIDEQAYLEDLKSSYTLTVDDTGLVTRDGGLDDDLTWVIKVNGVVQLERNASGEMTYRPMNYGEGKYQVYLESYTYLGYAQVSNMVEFTVPLEGSSDSQQQEDEEYGFERDRVTTKKGHMKHLVQTIRSGETPVDYKMGFVIDPDHDGYCNGVCIYAGVSDSGEEVQYAHDNDSSGIHFYNTDFGKDATIGIWFDTQNDLQYIAALTDNGAIDCCTGKTIENFAWDDNFFTYTSGDLNDRDHFFVAHHGKPVMEGA